MFEPPGHMIPDGPVFIVGMNGSGTTMLADSLGKHPMLYVFPHEVRVLPYLLQRSDRFGDGFSLESRRRFADKLGAARPFWQGNGHTEVVLSDAELAAPGFAATVDAMFMHFARQVGKNRWAEKSPMNLLHMEFLARVFPEAKFVHIIRDGRDAAQSVHRRYGFCPPETIYRWKRVVMQAQTQGAALGKQRYLELRYEQLTTDPTKWMARICRFLDLPFDSAVLGSSMRMADAAMVGENRIITNSGKWAAYFTPRQVAELESIAGQRLQALGYAVTTPGDVDPLRAKRLLWRSLGVVRWSIGHFRRWGWIGLPTFLRFIAGSLKQSASGRGG